MLFYFKIRLNKLKTRNKHAPHLAIQGTPHSPSASFVNSRNMSAQIKSTPGVRELLQRRPTTAVVPHHPILIRPTTGMIWTTKLR